VAFIRRPIRAKYFSLVTFKNTSRLDIEVIYYLKPFSYCRYCKED
jgi:hypothetical protein